ncbi:MAG: hypothetical protein IK142_05160 [Clostridiales bacterium]|nr:hypothetical protein [Clostridiales bacterium]
MIYDERYREQVFWDAPYTPELRILIGMIRDKALNRTEIIYPPAGKDMKTLGIGLGCSALFALLAGGLTFLITKVGLAAFIVGFIGLFMGFTVTAFLIARDRLLIRPQLMTSQVNAVCVGHSLTGGDGHMNRCPVFKYTYNGREYLAYDGNYSNRTKLPDIDEKLTIKIDPEHPEELMWNEGHNKNSFFFAALVCAIIFLGEIGMIAVTLCDKGIMGG